MATVYQAGDGQWIVFSNGIKTYFLNTQELEAQAMANKISFAEKAQDISTRLANIFDEATDLRSVYFDRGYNDVGSDPIIDGDISSLGITAANIASFTTMAEQLANFANNAPVSADDYDATVNALRTDI